MNNDLLKNITLSLPSIQEDWKKIRFWALSQPIPDVFQDFSRLKIFTDNFIEYFEEYGVLKNCEQEEYFGIILYYAKTSELEDRAPTGNSLRIILAVLNRITPTA